MAADGSSCPICGKVIGRGQAHCSSGCSLAAKVPRGETALPASWQLAVVMVAFLVLANQGLLASVWWIRAGRGLFSAMEAEGFRAASYVAGWIWAATAAAASAVAGIWRLSDRLALLAAFGVGALPWIAPEIIEHPVWSFFAANCLMAIWLHRGLWRLRRRQKGGKNRPPSIDG